MIQIIVNTNTVEATYFESDDERIDELTDAVLHFEPFTINDSSVGVVAVSPSNCASVSVSELNR
ncbi:hypothetical protein [Enterococcus avium]|uniref:hypothetical protein n=1 Tax=Enterococcus avium TaxID=33945 RepID=UPI0032E49649